MNIDVNNCGLGLGNIKMIKLYNNKNIYGNELDILKAESINN